LKTKATNEEAVTPQDIDHLLAGTGKVNQSQSFDFETAKTSPHESGWFPRIDTLHAFENVRRKCQLKRVDGTQVIWNAAGTFPMTRGYTMQIQGVDYSSSGVFNQNHLVIKRP
jgi:hypothetical protein